MEGGGWDRDQDQGEQAGIRLQRATSKVSSDTLRRAMAKEKRVGLSTRAFLIPHTPWSISLGLFSGH